jgi:SulP family sulfate permease
MLKWTRGYCREDFTADALAAVIVTLMLIPQSLAYALLAGLPAQAGLYASMVPLIAYALLGSSRVLAVGPVAVVSLMTAAAIGTHAPAGSPEYWQAALALSAMSGLMLLAMGVLRLGFIANFLSHPVISGFITASAVLIAASQLKGLLGIRAEGQDLLHLLPSLLNALPDLHGLTALIGGGTLAWLAFARSRLRGLLMKLGLARGRADMLVKAAPVLAIVVATALSAHLDWATQGVKVVGHIPAGLPEGSLPSFDLALWQSLLVPALLISIVGFVESVSVGQTLAAKRRERIEPDQELIALGASNLAAAVTSGMPVTGGFARSVVNFDAGARSPAAGLMTAAGIALAALLLTPWLAQLPQAVLAATIVIAVLSLVDVSVLTRTWGYSRADFAAVIMTLLGTLGLGVEAGLIAGVATSLILFLLRTSRPHIAEVGWVPGTEHFRNVQRHAVITSPELISLRVDESLYFANARALEDAVNAALARKPGLKHVVLLASAINDIDASALESLEAIEARLSQAGVQLHLSEVKGPVMDRLASTHFLKTLSGQVFLSHFQAIAALSPESLTSTGPVPKSIHST